MRLLVDGQDAGARDYLERMRAVFRDRLYVEVARRDDATEKQAEAALIALADDMEVALVATNPAHYADADFHAAHDIMLCIAGSAYVDSDDRAKSSPEAWIKPIESDPRELCRPARRDRQYACRRASLRGGGTQSQADPAQPGG